MKKAGLDPDTANIQLPDGYSNNRITNNIPDNVQQFLRERNFPELNKETALEIAQNLSYIQSKFDMDIGIGEIESNEIKGMIRSNKEIKQLDMLKEYETYQYQTKLDFNIKKLPPLDELSFNNDLLSGKFETTIIGIDTEAGSESESIAIQCTNYQARRFVLAIESPEFNWFEYLQADGSTYIYCTTPNLNDGLLLADAEGLLACLFISTLSQGQKELNSLMKKIRKGHFPSFNHTMFLEILNDLRVQGYVFHNTKYDVEMLKEKHIKNNRVLNVIQRVEPDVIDVSTFKKIENKIFEDQYKVHLGNTAMDFRYTLSTDNQGKYKRGKIKLAPGQKDSQPISYVIDTLISAKALQWTEPHPKYGFPSSGLLALSQVTSRPKDTLDDDAKIFSTDDFPVPVIFDEITKKYKLTDLTERQKEALYYCIQDTFSTIAVLAEITNKITWKSMEEILHVKIEKTMFPFLSSISSTASIAKHIIFAVLMHITGLNRKQIEKNIEKQRLFQKNFEKSYLGAKNEAFIQGLIKATKNKKLWYVDFASLYPHCAWLIEAMLLYQLSAQNELHKFARTDKKEAHAIISQSSQELYSAIKSIPKRFGNEDVPEVLRKLTKLNKDTFRRLIGQVNFTTSLKLLLPVRYNTSKNPKSKPQNRRTEVYKRGSQFHTMPDLVTAIVRYTIENNVSLRYVLRKINIWRAEYYVFPEEKYPSTEYGFEFFTRLYLRREQIKKQMETVDKKEEPELWNKLNSQQMLIKIIINSAYGVSAEGVSMEDHTGILFVPVIASIITAVARSLISLAEIIIDHLGGDKIYLDTDSIPHRIETRYNTALKAIFDDVCKLKDEMPKDPIKQIYISYKKAWGYITESGEVKFNKAGKGQYDSQRFDDAIKYMYTKIFTAKFSEKNIAEFARHASQIHSVEQIVSLNSTGSSYYKSIKPFFQKSVKTVYTFHFNGVKFNLKYDRKTDNYIITNTKKCILGQFGMYINASKGPNHKLILWVTIPIDMDEFVEFILDKFYIPGSDFFRNDMMKQTWGLYYHYILQMAKDFKKDPSNFLQSFDPNEILTKNYSKWIKLGSTYGLEFTKLDKNQRLELSSLDIIRSEANRLLPLITKNNILHHIKKIKGAFDGEKKKVSQWEKFYEFINHSLNEFHQSEALQWPNSFDPTDTLESWGYYWRRLCKVYELDPIKTAENLGLDLWQKIDDYDNLDSKFNEIMPKSQSIAQISSEDMYDYISEFSNMNFDVYEIYLSIFEHYFRDLSDVSNLEILDQIKNRRLAHFQGLESKLEILEEIYRIRPLIVKKLNNYFSLDAKQLVRNVKERNETYVLMEPYVIEKRAKEQAMKNYNKDLNTTIKTDHQTYSFNIPFGNIQWASELKANLDSYITKNIIATSISASKIYYATHEKKKYTCLQMRDSVVYHQDCVNPQCKIKRLIHSKKGVDDNLPCPKMNKSIRVPLLIQIKPRIRRTFNTDVDNYEYQLLDVNYLDPEIVKCLDSKKIIQLSNNKRWYVKDLDKFQDWEIKQFDKEWKELKLWGNKTWSVSIEHTDGIEYNSVLSIQIMPDKNSYFTFRSISASLSVNPSSFKLHNISLFETSINECLENENTLSELLTDLFHDNDIQIYTRNAGVTIEDINEKAKQELETNLSMDEIQIQDKNKGYYRQLFYTIMVKELIKRKLDYTTSRFSQLTVTMQKTYPNKNQEIEFAVGLATKSIVAQYTKNLPVDPKELIKAQKYLQVYPHKASTGISATNTNLKISKSSYKKDRRSQVSKANRMANYRNLSANQLKHLLESEMPENMLRHEIAMFGLETIIQRPDIELIKEVESYFDKAYKIASKILNYDPEIFRELNEEMPNFYNDYTMRMDEINNFDTPPPEVNNLVF